MSRLDELGRRVAAEQDRMLEARADVDLVRQRLLSGGIARPAARRRPWLAVAVAAGLAAALIAGFLLARHLGTAGPTPAIAPENWRPGASITAPDNAGVPIRFTDGSVVRLEPRAEACVLSASAAATRMVLRRGAAQVDVVHRTGVRWELEVGPFVVHVTGTSFRADWDPAAQTFHIALQRGAIDVTGPMLADGRRMAPGDVMRVWVAERRVEVRSDRGETVAAAPPAPGTVPPAGAGGIMATLPPAPPAVVAPPVSSGPVPAAPGPPASADIRGAAARTPPSARSAPSWQELAREGRYRDALVVAEAAGFERVLGGASATELVALGDAARLGGRADRGEQAYLALRRRFPGTSEAAVAAFDLARIAFDLRGDYDAAASWLRTCLAEPRASGVAREASGRLIEALQRAGHVDEAVAAARNYLQRDPTGPHAGYARALLAQEPEPRASP